MGDSFKIQNTWFKNSIINYLFSTPLYQTQLKFNTSLIKIIMFKYRKNVLINYISFIFYAVNSYDESSSVNLYKEGQYKIIENSIKIINLNI